MIWDSWLLSLPILIPLFGTVISYFFWKSTTIRTFLSLIQLVAAGLLSFKVIESGTIATSVGSWVAPYGIVLIADPFSVLMLLTTTIVFTFCLIGEKSKESLNSLLFLLQSGVSLSFLTGDLFNLFVAFEMILISSYAILALNAKKEALGNVYSYLSMNILASFIYLIAVAAFYCITGQLNLAAIAQFLHGQESAVVTVPLFIMCIVLIIKSGIFPLYFWLPDSYPLLPARLAALFGGILSKVGIYVFYRFYLTVFPHTHPWIDTFMLTLACLTMILGVIGAVSRGTIKGILSYHILSQVGYMLFALTLATPIAIAAGILFIVHNMVVKSSLFLIGGVAESICANQNIKKMGELFAKAPLLSVLFMLQAFSLAGIPPLSGFWGKYLIFFEGMNLESYAAVSLALITSFLTLFSMIKIWNGAFIGEADCHFHPVKPSALTSSILLTSLALIIGVFAGHFYNFSLKAAENLVDNRSYISISLQTGNKGSP